ncbi:hypothetical protein BC834DRAFT_454929 [Gloeopeniophorella convolvens]|nr:hypothetical protein BC834DRAFT_454929 [Gloeopeniophorella convolvens]
MYCIESHRLVGAQLCGLHACAFQQMPVTQCVYTLRRPRKMPKARSGALEQWYVPAYVTRRCRSDANGGGAKPQATLVSCDRAGSGKEGPFKRSMSQATHARCCMALRPRDIRVYIWHLHRRCRVPYLLAVVIWRLALALQAYSGGDAGGNNLGLCTRRAARIVHGTCGLHARVLCGFHPILRQP